MRKLIIIIVFVLVACAPPSIKPVATDATTPAATQTAQPTATAPQSTATAYTVSGSWYIRECASVHCDVVRVALDGEQITPMLETDNWYRLADGWINKGCCGNR